MKSMNFCEHKDNYNLALKYFPDCFERLQLRNDIGDIKKMNFDAGVLQKGFSSFYGDFFNGFEYLNFLDSSLTNLEFKHSEFRALYLLYDNLVRLISNNIDLNRKTEYDYLLIITILKYPIMKEIQNLDKYSDISLSGRIDTGRIGAFVLDWLCKFSDCCSSLNSNKDNNLVEDFYYEACNMLNEFYQEILEVAKLDSLLWCECDKVKDGLIEINNNPNVLSRKK